MPDVEHGNPKRGWGHIFPRHVPGRSTNQGGLFRIRLGETDAQIESQLRRAMGRVWSQGQRISSTNSVMQVFEKRMTINGLSARYRLLVDTANNKVVTFFPALSS